MQMCQDKFCQFCENTWDRCKAHRCCLVAIQFPIGISRILGHPLRLALCHMRPLVNGRKVAVFWDSNLTLFVAFPFWIFDTQRSHSRLFRFKIMQYEPSVLSLSNIGEITCPGSWHDSTITLFVSKLLISHSHRRWKLWVQAAACSGFVSNLIFMP